MEENNSRQEEARRVLEAIRQKSSEANADQPASTQPTSDPSTKPEAKPDAKPIVKPFSTVGSEDAAQLQALVTSSLGIKNQPVEAEEPETAALVPEPITVEPISTEQIKVMRKYATKKAVTNPPITTVIYQGIIKAYFDVVDYFKPSIRAQKCLTEGHQCLHCGKKFEEPASKSPKEKQVPSAAGEQNG